MTTLVSSAFSRSLMRLLPPRLSKKKIASGTSLGMLVMWICTTPVLVQAQTQLKFSQKQFSTGSAPVSVVSADFNGDGRPDVAIALRDQRMVEIRLQQADGSFTVGQQFATCGNPVKLVVGDFNHDGKMDVASLNAKGTTCAQASVDYMLGDGAGGVFFQDTELVPNDVADIAAADVNGDGETDVVLAQSSKTLYTLLSGDFQSPSGPFRAVTSTPQTPGTQFTALTAGDFDHDGKVDVAVGTCCSGNPDTENGDIAVLKGAGDGTFGTTITTISPAYAQFLRTIDINQDGYADILSIEHNITANSVVVYTNDKTGKFSRNLVWAFPDQDQYIEPPSATVGDFNGDGLVDVAFITYDQTTNVGESYVAVALQNADHAFAPVQMFDLGNNVGTADIAPFQVAGSSSLPDLVTVNTNANSFTVLTNTTGSGTCAAPSANGINVCSPTNNSTVSSPVHVVASAKVSGSIYRFELWDGSTKVASVANNTTMDVNVSLSNGSHKLTFVARNADGSSRMTTSVNITVGSGGGNNCSAPTTVGIVVCSPTDGSTVSSPVTIQAYAKTSGTIYRFELWANGVKRASEANSGVMNEQLAFSPGTYTLTFSARNTAGTKITKTEHITVH